MRGCGKSTLTRILSKDYDRKIVFDMVEEWTGTHEVSSVQDFKNIWRSVFHEDTYTIVVRFSFGQSSDEISEIQTEITKIVYHTGRESELETCIIFEEAQFYFPNQGLPAINMHLLTTGRHAFINIIANTQRPASISKLLVSQSHDIYIGQLYESNDLKFLRETVGSMADEARKLKSLEFMHYVAGSPDETYMLELS